MKLYAASILALIVLVSAGITEDLNPSIPSEDSEFENAFYGLDKRLAWRSGSTCKRVYTMYHGTTVPAAESIIKTGFRRSTNGMLGPGVYVSRDIRKAQNYPLGIAPNLRVVLKLRVRVGRVKKIDRQGHPLQFTWHQHGYDTAWVPPNCGMVPSNLEEDCVWDPKRIKVVDVVQAPPYAMGRLKALLRRRPSECPV